MLNMPIPSLATVRPQVRAALWESASQPRMTVPEPGIVFGAQGCSAETRGQRGGGVLACQPTLQHLDALADLGRCEGGGDLVEGAGRARVDIEKGASRLARGVWQDRDAAKHLRVKLSRNPVAAVAAEDPELLAAVRTLCVAHILDDPGDLEVRLHGHLSGLDGDAGRVRLRRGDDERLGLGDHLGHGKGDVAGARRHVHDDEVGLVPVDVAHELGERLVHYGGTPDDGLPLVDEVTHGDELQPLGGLYGEDHTLHHVRLAERTEHHGDGRPVHVGVEDLHGVSRPVERGGQVYGYCALADSPLAAHHGDDAGLGLVPEGGGQLRRAAVQRREEVLAVLVGHHAEVDLHTTDALDHHQPVGDVGDDPVLERTARRRKRDTDRDVRTLYLDALDHVQRDEISPDLRVPHVPQCFPYTGLGEPIGRLVLLGTAVHELFRRLGLEMCWSPYVIRRPGLASAKPVNHVYQPP